MAGNDLGLRILDRAIHAGVTPADEFVSGAVVYLELLARWNRRINLTAFPLTPPTDDAIDRLIVEPLVASRHIAANERRVVDIGSGGGSPAIPLKLAAPSLQIVLVEARVRKSAFLREVVRTLGLRDMDVETSRFELSWHRRDLDGTADLVTVRAVRADMELWNGLHGLLRPHGRIFWFTRLAKRPIKLNHVFDADDSRFKSTRYSDASDAFLTILTRD